MTSVCQAKSVDLQLLARSQIDIPPLDLSEGDRQWLTGKAALTLGTSSPDYAPFDISTGSDYFEGVTADYAGLLSHLLQVPFKVRRYASGRRDLGVETGRNRPAGDRQPGMKWLIRNWSFLPRMRWTRQYWSLGWAMTREQKHCPVACNKHAVSLPAG